MTLLLSPNQSLCISCTHRHSSCSVSVSSVCYRGKVLSKDGRDICRATPGWTPEGASRTRASPSRTLHTSAFFVLTTSATLTLLNITCENLSSDSFISTRRGGHMGAKAAFSLWVSSPPVHHTAKAVGRSLKDPWQSGC